MTGFAVTLDGVNIEDPLSYRFFSDDVFRFKGDLSLAPDFDSCVTGKHLEGVVDGFYLLFKPLSRGDHLIVVERARHARGAGEADRAADGTLMRALPSLSPWPARRSVPG